MWLINATTLRLEDFHLREVPPYAILSHTWSNHEVTFQDVVNLTPIRLLKRGYLKIVQTCRLAKKRHLNYAWVDTCCIDKTSSAELTESINSMFSYYEQAAICFAHLADLPPSSKNIASCRWFTRGWTLQELLAPEVVEFYDSAWEYLGSKTSFVDVISSTTNIPESALEEHCDLHDFSVAARMSWASGRQSTRIEDTAYCLLGIFGVSMPLIYGEGIKAFQRLQEEIVKRDADMTIFAWSSSVESERLGVNLLAPSPHVFSGSASVKRAWRAKATDVIGVNFTLTNCFLELNLPVYELPVPNNSHKKVLGVRVGELGEDIHPIQSVFMPLRLITPRLLCRHKDFPTTFGIVSNLRQWQYQTGDMSLQRIVTYNIERSLSMFTEYREDAVRLVQQPGVILTKVLPEQIWDPQDEVLLRSRALDDRPEVITLCFKSKEPNVQSGQARRYTSWLVSCKLDMEPLRAGTFLAQSRSEIFEFAQRLYQHPDLAQKLDYTSSDGIISVLNGRLTITASLPNLNSRTTIHDGKIANLPI